MTPFEQGPDRTLELVGSDERLVTPMAIILMFDERYDRMLVEIDGTPCWLPNKFTRWKFSEPAPPTLNIFIRAPDGRKIPSEPAPQCGPARLILPRWLADNLDQLSTAALLDRRAAEAAAREAEKEAERKREQLAQQRRMGEARKAAKEKKARSTQLDLL